MTDELRSDGKRRRRPWLRRLVVLAVVLLVLGMLAAWWSGPSVPGTAVLVVDLRQPVPERADEGIEQVLGGAPLDLLGLRRALQAAAGDPRVRGVLLRVGAGGLDLAQAEEIRGMLGDFASAEKFTIGFGQGPDGAGYLLLCAADQVILDPAADLNLVGVSLEAFFIADALRPLGLEFDLVRAGEYKGTYEQLKHSRPSPEFQKALGETADALYQVLVEEIASSRKITPAQVRSAIDEGPLSPARAVEARLADRLAYQDELRRIIAERSGGVEATPIDAAEYLEAVGESGGGARMAVVHVRGLIADTAGPAVPLLGRVTGADEVVSALRDARDDPSVRALVLRIDSPGGTLSGAERIWREVEATRKQKPVVATMGSAAASGGYYIACAAERVIARPATITGSIGVFGGKLVLEKLLADRGVHVEAAARGRRAGMFSLARRFSDDQRAALERVVQDGYRQFVDRVAVGRKRPSEEVERLARGRVWTGSQALEHELVDELGGIEEAVTAARRLARIPDGEPVDLVLLPARRSLFEVLVGRKRTAPLLQGAAPAAALGPWAHLVDLLDGRRPLAIAPELLNLPWTAW